MDKELLYKFFNGETTEAEDNKIRQWEESQLENRKKVIEERKLFDSLILFSNEEELKKTSFIKRLFFSSRAKELLKTAAVVAITILSTLLVSFFTKEKQVISMQTLSAPAGQRINIELSDGTKVWLNSCSSIKYPTNFSDKKRKLELEGEAYFEVAHNKTKPFIVKTFKGEVEVLGTKFNILASRRNKEFVTSLMEGSVKVSDEKNSVVIKPKQMVQIKDDRLYVSSIKDYDAYRWREGLVCFKDELFAEIINKIEDCYGVTIIIQNKTLLKNRYSGKLRTSDGVFYALRILQRDLHFSVLRSETSNKIYIK